MYSLAEASGPIDPWLKHRYLRLVLFCSWLLMFVTLSTPGRDQQVLGTLDIIGFAKVIARAISLTLLAPLLLRLWHFPNRNAVISCLFPMILFVGLAIVSTLWSPLVSVTLGQSGSLSVLLMLATALGILATTERDASTILCSVSTALLIISCILLMARLFLPWMNSISRDGAGVFHATSAGAASSLGIIILIACRFLWNWKWSQHLLPFTLIHVVVLLLAVNRTSLVLTIVLVAFILFCNTNRVLALTATVFFCIAATVYLVVDPGLQTTSSFLESATAYANRGQSASDIRQLSGRQEMWEKVWAAYQESIWLGHGYSVCSPTGRLFVWLGWANWTAHNVVLQCLMSTGLVGFSLLLWALGRIGYRWVLNRYRGHLSRELTFLVSVILLWNVVWGMFNSSFLGPVSPESVTTFVVLGLAVGQLSACNAPAAIGYGLNAGPLYAQWSDTSRA